MKTTARTPKRITTEYHVEVFRRKDGSANALYERPTVVRRFDNPHDAIRYAGELTGQADKHTLVKVVERSVIETMRNAVVRGGRDSTEDVVDVATIKTEVVVPLEDDEGPEAPYQDNWYVKPWGRGHNGLVHTEAVEVTFYRFRCHLCGANGPAVVDRREAERQREQHIETIRLSPLGKEPRKGETPAYVTEAAQHKAKSQTTERADETEGDTTEGADDAGAEGARAP